MLDKSDEWQLTEEADSSNGASRKLEAIFLALWRRSQKSGDGLDLTLAEAAALLGISVESVRRRIKAGEIRSRRDLRGRLRVVPVSPSYQSQWAQENNAQASSVGELWDKLIHAAPR